MKSLDRSKIKVLLVEDQLIAQKIAEMILGSLNCEVVIAQNGEGAIQFFLQEAYDLILMDIGLPDKDGFKVSAEIRAIEEKGALASTPIVGLSAHAPKTARKQAMEAGMNSYLVKPMTLGMCQGILNQFVGSSQKSKREEEKAF